MMERMNKAARNVWIESSTAVIVLVLTKTFVFNGITDCANLSDESVETCLDRENFDSNINVCKRLSRLYFRTAADMKLGGRYPHMVVTVRFIVCHEERNTTLLH